MCFIFCVMPIAQEFAAFYLEPCKSCSPWGFWVFQGVSLWLVQEHRREHFPKNCPHSVFSSYFKFLMVAGSVGCQNRERDLKQDRIKKQHSEHRVMLLWLQSALAHAASWLHISRYQNRTLRISKVKFGCTCIFFFKFLTSDVG